ncbi:uncharacterized protein [Malus domestica]|uniref:uncharacterized protein isoform X1 n=1 Tax=Malus domestica TaxID=3750 RepID=UPI0039765F04
MVGMMMTANSHERLAGLMDSAIFAADIPSKLDRLRQSKQDLVRQQDPDLLSELLPRFFELQSDRFSPVRKFATEMLGEIGLMHVELLPDIVPSLIDVLSDETPAVARQAITSGSNLFRCVLEKVSIQGLHASELDSSLESAWACVLKLKDEIYSIAFRPGSGGVRLRALKFVESVILLYTPDPNGSPGPPALEGDLVEFNVSWLRGGHPLLNVGDLSIEASKSLGLLLDQLRFPTVKSLGNLVIVVLINSLSAIARKRPAFYGRILPVLLGFDPSSNVINGVHVSGPRHALKNAFLTCLKCTHQGAAPWRDRLVGALRKMQAGGLVELATQQECKINGSVEDGLDDSLVTKEEKPTITITNAVQSSFGKKRLGALDGSDLAVDQDVSGKRAKSTSSFSGDSAKEVGRNVSASLDDVSSSGTTTSRGDGDNGPVQQLVAMFGALVAQGEKAVGSLEILISSISADLLAEVVMANMCNLPPNLLGDEGDESLMNMHIVGGDSRVKYPPSFIADVLSLTSTFPPIAALLDAHQSVSSDIVKSEQEEEQVPDVVDSGVASTGMDYVFGDETAILPMRLPASSEMEHGCPSLPSDHDMEYLESEIPGLDSACNSGSEPIIASSSTLMDVEDASQEQVTSVKVENACQEQVTSMGQRTPLNLLPSLSTDKSEELSPRAAVADVSVLSSTATSVGLSHHLVLPKMSAPVVILSDEEKDWLQQLAFTRIIEAYKQIAVAGGSQIRCSLLISLGVEFPLELDPWKLLQKHILADYTNNEGHELTLRVLYRLFGEAEEERDFFSSTTATSVYEMFLSTAVDTLRDSFPPSDKSLSRLLGEVPYLPDSVLKFLECMCSPGNCDKTEKETQGGDRVTQGLSIVWSLILLRPPLRDPCLKIALQSAVHHLEEVRMKAIRLVANKLYPLSFIAQRIEDFAIEKLLSLKSCDATEKIDAEGSKYELQKDSDSEKHSNEPPSVSGNSKDISSDNHQSFSSQNVSSLSIAEAQRCLSLYFALCTKKHSLFRQIFVVYGSASKAIKQAVQRQIPILVRTMGSSPNLLEIISDPPTGSENLLMQVLHTLTDGTVPSQELIFTVRKLYDSKLKDIEILIPILPFLPKDEVLLIFPQLMNLQLDKFQAALARILQGSSQSGPLLAPAEILIAIHGIDPDRDGIPLKKVTDACNACFEQRQIFTQQVLAKVLNQLVEQIPLPLLFMRTVLQAIGAFPALVDFIMEILSRLVSKQIWKYPKLWVGFLKCTFLTKPQSFAVLLQLPPAQLENALKRTAALKGPLVAHASQPDIRSSLPRSILVVLGIVSDSPAQTSQSQAAAQTSQSQAAAQTSQSHAAAQTSQSQAVAQASQFQAEEHTSQSQAAAQTSQFQAEAHTSQSQAEAQTSQSQAEAQTSQSQTEAQSSQSQAGEASNSEKEAVTEKPKESSSAS